MSASDSPPLAPTIREILGDEDLALLFREFLHQLKCAENLSFYVEVEEYKRLKDPSERAERGIKIWNKYLSNDSQTPINIDSKCRQQIQSSFEAGDVDAFNEASEFVYGMLSFDCYRKFIASDTYSKWLNDAKKKPKWNFLFFKKKPVEGKMQKTESLLLLQKYVQTTGAKK